MVPVVSPARTRTENTERTEETETRTATSAKATADKPAGQAKGEEYDR